MNPNRVLMVVAHPDDESLMAGGTLAACATAGIEVDLLCMTRGENGPISDRSEAIVQNLGTVREAELRSASRVLGLHQVVCLNFPDGCLQWTDASSVAAYLDRWMERRVPDVVITFGMEGLYWHPDHIAVHRFVTAAVERCGVQGASIQLLYATWPVGLLQRLIGEMASRGVCSDVWGLDPDAFGVEASNISVTIDIREFVSTKLAALRCHISQMTSKSLFVVLDNDVAHELFSHEYFVLGRSGGKLCDWLETLTARRAASYDQFS